MNIIVLLCFILNFVYLVKANKITITNVLRTILKQLAVLLCIVSFSLAGSWLISSINGVSYKLIGLANLRFDELFSIFSLILTTLLIAISFKRMTENNMLRLKEYIIASEFLLLVFSIIIFSITGENFFLLFPLVFSMISRAVKGLKSELVITVTLSVLLLFLVIPFTYSIYIALSTGAIFIPLSIITLVLFAIVPEVYSVSTKLV